MNDMNTTDRALGWDDEFTNEQQEFVLLPEGDYAFEVTGMERARFEGSAKLPPCSMAKLTLKIFGGAKGDTTVTHRLYLHTKTQGLLGAFFESIGQCKRGETFRPRWNEVVGAKGISRVQDAILRKIQMMLFDKLLHIGGAKVFLSRRKCIL